jgi:hypothetical protein
MTELEVYEITDDGLKKADKVRAFIHDGIGEYKSKNEDGITKEQFHSILDKASQPIEKPKSEKE